jgi:hypothetical protein
LATTVELPSVTDTSTTPGAWAGVWRRSIVGHATDTWATAPPRRTSGRSGKPSPPTTIVLPPEREPASGDTDTIRSERDGVGAGVAGKGTTVLVVDADGVVVGVDAAVVGVLGAGPAVVGVLGARLAVVGVFGPSAAVVGVVGNDGAVVGVGGAGVDGVLGAGDGGGMNTGTGT